MASSFDSARLESSKTKLDTRKLKMLQNAHFSLAMSKKSGHIRHQVSEDTLYNGFTKLGVGLWHLIQKKLIFCPGAW